LADSSVGGEILLGHADAGIRDRQGPRLLVGGDADLGVRRQGARRRGERLEPPPVHGVGRVGDEFAQEDLAVGVERVHDEVEEASDLRPEFVPLDLLAHG
jgi:hypothetical protein